MNSATQILGYVNIDRLDWVNASRMRRYDIKIVETYRGYDDLGYAVEYMGEYHECDTMKAALEMVRGIGIALDVQLPQRWRYPNIPENSSVRE
jgi:hypothetical protein